VTVPLGDLTAAQFRIVAELAWAHGDGAVRVTTEQNFVFRWVPLSQLKALYRGLQAAGLGLGGVGTIADVGSCPGAESCRLAVTQSRGLGRLLEEHLRAHPDVTGAAGSADVKISGCPNGCGQHHVAALGFQGSIRKIGARAAPHYLVMVGGGVDEGGAVFGRAVARIPARRAPEAVDRLVGLYAAGRQDGETLAGFFRRADVAQVKSALADLERLGPADAVPLDFVDLGEEHEFTPEIQDGECSA